MDEKPRRGRPPKADALVAVTLRLSPKVIDDYKSAGKDWRARISADLTEATARRKAVEAELHRALRPHVGKPITAATKEAAVGAVSRALGVPTFERKAFNPQPKMGKKK